MNPLDNPQTEIPTRTSDPLLISALYLSVITVAAHSAPLCPASNAFDFEVFWADTRLVFRDNLVAQYHHIYR